MLALRPESIPLSVMGLTPTKAAKLRAMKIKGICTYKNTKEGHQIYFK